MQARLLVLTLIGLGSACRAGASPAAEEVGLDATLGSDAGLDTGTTDALSPDAEGGLDAAERDAAERDASADGSSPVDASAADAGPEPVYGYCSKPCGTVADCCPAGAVDCPSATYPYNYACVAGACRPPRCATTADCASVDPVLDCYMLGGEPECVTPCASDGDCRSPLTCVGHADDGRGFCLAIGGTGCTDEASCHGFGRCVSRVCVCESFADCTHAGFTACAL